MLETYLLGDYIQLYSTSLSCIQWSALDFVLELSPLFLKLMHISYDGKL